MLQSTDSMVNLVLRLLWQSLVLQADDRFSDIMTVRLNVGGESISTVTYIDPNRSEADGRRDLVSK